MKVLRKLENVLLIRKLDIIRCSKSWCLHGVFEYKKVSSAPSNYLIHDRIHTITKSSLQLQYCLFLIHSGKCKSLLRTRKHCVINHLHFSIHEVSINEERLKQEMEVCWGKGWWEGIITEPSTDLLGCHFLKVRSTWTQWRPGLLKPGRERRPRSHPQEGIECLVVMWPFLTYNLTPLLVLPPQSAHTLKILLPRKVGPPLFSTSLNIWTKRIWVLESDSPEFHTWLSLATKIVPKATVSCIFVPPGLSTEPGTRNSLQKYYWAAFSDPQCPHLQIVTKEKHSKKYFIYTKV